MKEYLIQILIGITFICSIISSAIFFYLIARLFMWIFPSGLNIFPSHEWIIHPVPFLFMK